MATYCIQGFAGYPLTAFCLHAEGKRLLKQLRSGEVVLTPEQIDSAIRISFSKDTTEAEIDALLSALSDAIAKLRPIIEKNGKERP